MRYVDVLRDCLTYCKEQIETSRVSVLRDDTNEGYESQAYYEMQLKEINHLLKTMK